eukprot:TRINITY_DN7998_c0_g1_i1.p1 TRINITY_DN7998_c0_g1~~TRINITY_DN7998_c0_g1_i1.p1  ORF type:complete len:561 (+),score=187.76 TRINITY_DN7998_c0_g1_i1:64-1683(+)
MAVEGVKKGKGTAGQGDKQRDVRMANIAAAKAVADAVRTSLGPRGMDKMIVHEGGDVTITNDGATIMDKLEVHHPCAKMLIELSRAQDVEAGDGTTSVVVMCGALLKAAQSLLHKEIHPSDIAASFLEGGRYAAEILQNMSRQIDINDRETLIKAAVTSLSSKVVSQNSALLAPMAVDAVYTVRDPAFPDNVDLNNIKVHTCLGGTMEDTELITNGTIFKQKASQSAGGPTKVQNAKIALIQFQLSPPKTDMEMQVAIKDYQQIDRVIKQERKYLLEMCKKIKDAGCNVLLIQKSILRDAVNEQSLDFLAKMKIMVLKDIERNDVDFITKTLGCLPISSIDSFKAEKFGHADLVVQESTPEGKIVRVTGIKPPTTEIAKAVLKPTATVLIKGSNSLLAAEAERSFHDALCVVRSLVKKTAVVAGGGAPETQLTIKLAKKARELEGIRSFCLKSYAEAFEIIPYTLAENAGLNPVRTVTELRNKHNEGEEGHGINVRKACVTDMSSENVVVPLLVPHSAVKLATETVAMILKIDDIVQTR